jgi:hypothetical protein
MKKETIYECPVCHARYDTCQDAIECRGLHYPLKSEWCSCEICGQGWKVSGFGIGVAEQLARKCESAHQQNSEALIVGVRNFFASGGFVGKPRVLKGK